MADPVTRLVEQIAEALVRPEEIEDVWGVEEGDVLRIHLRATSHGATAALVGSGGVIITAMQTLARHAARGRWRDVRLQIERDHLPARIPRAVDAASP